MLRNERPRFSDDAPEAGVYHLIVPESKELFIGEPSTLRGQAYAIGGWPNWLIPAYQLKGHRPAIQLLEEER